MIGLNFDVGFKASVVSDAVVVHVFFTHLLVEWPDVYLFIKLDARLNLSKKWKLVKQLWDRPFPVDELEMLQR
jgi:hypothetical protein